MSQPPLGNLGARSGKFDPSGEETTSIPRIARRDHPLQQALVVHIDLGRKRDPEKVKVPYEDANYAQVGPFPFTCGTCRFIIWGVAGEDPEGQMEETEGSPDRCMIVEGPEPGGGILPEATCRLWKTRPAYHSQDEEELDGDPDDPAD